MLVHTRRSRTFWRHLVVGLGGAILLAALPPAAALAEQVPQPNFSTDQARAVFVNAGYVVDQPTNWEWLEPAVSAFQVHDIARDRVLLVQVCPDIAQAQRWNARPVEGYSASTWLDNLVVSEANADDYLRTMENEQARSLGMQPESQFDVVVASADAQKVDAIYTSLLIDALLQSSPS